MNHSDAIEKAAAFRDRAMHGARIYRDDAKYVAAAVRSARTFNKLMVWNMRAARRLAKAREVMS